MKMDAKDVWEKSRSWECISSEDRLNWVAGVDRYVIGKVEGAIKTFDLEKGEICGGIEAGTDQDPILAVTTILNREAWPNDRTYLDLDDNSDEIEEKWSAFTAHKSGLIRKWSGSALTLGRDTTEEPEPTSLFKSDHKSPILHLCAVSPEGSHGGILVSVGADFVNKVWDVEKRHLVGILRGITAVAVCNDITTSAPAQNQVVVASGLADGAVKVWKITLAGSGQIDDDEEGLSGISVDPTPITLTKHNSQIAAVALFENGSKVAAFGRDQLISLWDVSSESCLHLVPTYEEIERAVILRQCHVDKYMPGKSGSYCLAAGEKGQIRMWNVSTGVEADASQLVPEKTTTSLGLVGKIHDLHLASDGNSLLTVRDDLIVKTRLGLSDDQSSEDQGPASLIYPLNQSEVLDFALVSSKSSNKGRLIVATNQPHLRVYHVDSGQMTVAHSPSGHTDAVMAVSAVKHRLDHVPSSPNIQDYFVSCGKDQSVCLWKFEGLNVKLVGKGTGHSSYVGAVAMSTELLFSASKDGVLKSWTIPEDPSDPAEVQSLKTKRTVAAHQGAASGQKSLEGSETRELLEELALQAELVARPTTYQMEVNSLDVSFDGELVVTGSQDKTAKLWRSSDLGLVATLSGHRRGIWATKFFLDGNRLLIATASADATVKLWEKNSFGSFGCVQTLEGHLASVLGVASLLPTERKVATVSSDGLLKVWNLEQSASASTDVGSFEAHEDKIWAVAYVPGDGGAMDGTIVTGGRDGQMALWRNVTDRVRQEEKSKLEETIRTDQKLSNYIQQGHLTKALKICLKTGKPRMARETLAGIRKRGQLKEALSKLTRDEKNVLHGLLVKWNSYGTQCALAQDALKVLIVDAMVNDQKLSASACAGLIAYSEKHYQRLDKLHSKLAVVDLLLDNM